MPNIQAAAASNSKDMFNKLRTYVTGHGTDAAPGYAGTGDGVLSNVQPKTIAVSETWTITCTTGGGFGVGIFSVTGSVSGAQAAATVGQFYENTLLEMVIQDGAIDFVVTDAFTIVVTEGEMITDGFEWVEQRFTSYVTNLDNSTFLTPANALDGLPTTKTNILIGSAGIWQVDMGVAAEMDSYTITSITTGFDATEMIRTWTLQYSDNNIDWTTADTQASEVGWAGGEARNYVIAAAGRHLYWRLNVTNNNGGTDTEFSKFAGFFGGDSIDSFIDSHFILKGVGLAGADEIYLGYAIAEDASTPFFNIEIMGFIAYNSAEAWNNQPGASTPVYHVLSDAAMTYWLVCTGRKIILKTKLSTVYTDSYAGFMLPYGLPSEYPYPLLIAGNCEDRFNNAAVTDDDFRMFCNPGNSSMWLRDPGGTWIDFENHVGTSVTEQHGVDRIVWPWGSESSPWGANEIEKFREGIDGSYAIMPCIIHQVDTGPFLVPNTYGELDGVFWVSGFSNSSENSFTISADDYICFQDVFRTDLHHFMALRLD